MNDDFSVLRIQIALKAYQGSVGETVHANASAVASVPPLSRISLELETGEALARALNAMNALVDNTICRAPRSEVVLAMAMRRCLMNLDDSIRQEPELLEAVRKFLNKLGFNLD